MSSFWIGNTFLLLSILLASGSQVLLKRLLNQGLIQKLSPADWQQVVIGETGFWLLAMGMLLVGGFLCWVMALNKLDLIYAYPIACSSAFFVALFSHIFVGEIITARMLGGTVLIVIGTIFLVPSA